MNIRFFNRTLIAILFIPFFVNAQNAYERGYIIKRNGKRIDCLIKTQKGIYNPTNLHYKITEESPIEIGTIDSIKEFVIENRERFIAMRIQIDRSGDNLNQITSNRQPVWSSEELFLKVLVEGKGTLYSYFDISNRRFFFSIDNNAPQQLIYKKFIVNSNQTAFNKSYLMQLQSQVNCQGSSDHLNISYEADPLIKYFKAYNLCVESGIQPKLKQEIVVEDWSGKKLAFNTGINMPIGKFASTAVSDKSGYARAGFHFEAIYSQRAAENKFGFIANLRFSNFGYNINAAAENHRFDRSSSWSGKGEDWNAFSLNLGCFRSFKLTNKLLAEWKIMGGAMRLSSKYHVIHGIAINKTYKYRIEYENAPARSFTYTTGLGLRAYLNERIYLTSNVDFFRANLRIEFSKKITNATVFVNQVSDVFIQPISSLLFSAGVVVRL